MSSEPPLPPPLPLPTTAAQLKAAKRQELKCWADQINKRSLDLTGQKAFKSVTGNQQFLQELLAAHLKIDLSTPADIDLTGDAGDSKPIPDPTALQMAQQQYQIMMMDTKQWGFEEPYTFSGEFSAL